MRFAVLPAATDLDTRVAIKFVSFLVPSTSSLGVNRNSPLFKMVVDFHSIKFDSTAMHSKMAVSPVAARCLPFPISMFDVITGTLNACTVNRTLNINYVHIDCIEAPCTCRHATFHPDI